MSVTTNNGDFVNVVFVYQKNEQVEEVSLNSAQLTALLQARQVWMEKFHNNLKIENTVWSHANGQVILQVYLR